MTKRDAFKAAAAQRILIKDGPYGTEIQRARLAPEDYAGDTGLPQDQKGNNDLVNLTQPQVIRAICDSYMDAGAHILATNTFNANAMSQADYDLEHLVYELNVAGAMCAKKAVQAFSPAASATPLSRRSAARAAKSSGGKTGSSSQ